MYAVVTVRLLFQVVRCLCVADGNSQCAIRDSGDDIAEFVEDGGQWSVES